MKRLLPLLLLISCGKPDTLAVQSQYRRSELEHIAAVHLSSMATYNNTIVWDDGNPLYPQNQGNANLFHGLLCYSGHLPSCELAISLRCSTGHLKRAPWRTCGDESRDEFIGQAFVSLKTSSTFTLPSSYPSAVTPTWARTMQLSGYSIKGIPDHLTLLAQAKTVPLGYQLHLAALQAWVRRIKGEDTKALDLTFVELRSRDPKNLFFRYLRSGPTEDVVDAFLAFAPPVSVKKQAQWVWQDPPNLYGNGRVHSAAIVFLANLLLK